MDDDDFSSSTHVLISVAEDVKLKMLMRSLFEQTMPEFDDDDVDEDFFARTSCDRGGMGGGTADCAEVDGPGLIAGGISEARRRFGTGGALPAGIVGKPKSE